MITEKEECENYKIYVERSKKNANGGCECPEGDHIMKRTSRENYDKYG